MSVVLGVQLVLVVGFETVTVMVVLVEQVPLTPADGLTLVGLATAGADSTEETTGAATEETEGLASTTEVEAATLVEPAALLTGADAYALDTDTAGAALLEEGA